MSCYTPIYLLTNSFHSGFGSSNQSIILSFRFSISLRWLHIYTYRNDGFLLQESEVEIERQIFNFVASNQITGVYLCEYFVSLDYCRYFCCFHFSSHINLCAVADGFLCHFVFWVLFLFFFFGLHSIFCLCC